MASAFADDGAVVDIVGTIALAAMELGAVFLPGKGITGAAILFKTVGTLALIGDEHIVVAAGADDDTVVGAKYTVLLVLKFGGKRNILCGPLYRNGQDCPRCPSVDKVSDGAAYRRGNSSGIRDRQRLQRCRQQVKAR